MTFESIKEIRNRFWHWRFGWFKKYLIWRSERKVIEGPFRGMRYVLDSVGSAYYPKLLGIYEKELWPAIRDAISYSFKTVVNVGAGEGYYAVGLALKMPSSHIVAFEADSKGRVFMDNMACANDVSNRIQIKGFCDVGSLKRSFSDLDPSLVVMDVEGAEKELLDPDTVPELLRCFVLVEIHDFVDRSLADKIRRRFESTHLIQEIWQEDRVGSDFPSKFLCLGIDFKNYTRILMNEGRPERMRWFYMKPKFS